MCVLYEVSYLVLIKIKRTHRLNCLYPPSDSTRYSMRLWTLLTFCSVKGILAQQQNGTTVCTMSGTCYSGSSLVSNEGTKYFSFQGIRSVMIF